MTPEQRERRNARRRAWRAENREKYREQTRLEGARRRARPEVQEDARRRTHAWRLANPEKFLDILYRKYGLTYAEYAEMDMAQDGRCAICDERETATQRGKVRRLAVDHNHATGAVRALLCQRCNHAIGQMKDDPALLRRAAEYLESHA